MFIEKDFFNERGQTLLGVSSVKQNGISNFLYTQVREEPTKYQKPVIQLLIECLGIFTLLFRLGVQINGDANDLASRVSLVAEICQHIQKGEIYYFDKLVSQNQTDRDDS